VKKHEEGDVTKRDGYDELRVKLNNLYW